ncbi:peptide/nickel transport system substrate-binding protein [Acetitomaculum ruminis DSM 5522]|uniref:Peptide/nickel transport system substrate-binding protein n=1 Tax=Acetitomaculum ruminis DSM 5522 TaxID=1120918 RepID=A0A1I0ZBE3_9FIRM|nr:ABC transporter substrate-binding protein [Acetitomaculum ruminis]SFB22964.1 peptide/nickel transport system substrate-binding protein [Acetitomaculum ruminis DSM 5522]
MKKTLVLLMIAAMTFASLAGCGKEVSKSDKSSDKVSVSKEAQDSHVNIALFTYIEGMDPATDWCGWNLTRCGVGETLVTVNENMEIEPLLADSYEQVDDTTYSFHIRKGVKFSNGTELTPEIVKASIERSIENNSRGQDLKIDSIKVDGENVIFTTKEPFSAFVYNMTEPMTVIVDTTADTSNYDTKPICTGPYYVKEYVSEEKIELEANENYWDKVAEIKSITALNIDSDTKTDAILAGDIDLAQGPAATTLSNVEGNDDVDIVKVTGTRENDFWLNCKEDSPLGDVNLRLALSYAIDRDVVAKVAGNGYSSPLTTAFPETVGYDSDKVKGQNYDVDKAKECLENAGYKDSDSDGYVDKNGENLELKISLSSSSNSAVSETLQDMWEKIGVKTEIEMLEDTSTIRKNGDFDILADSGWQTVNAGDGQKYLANRWKTDSTDNYGKYTSEKFEAVLEKLDKAFDKDERIAAFVEAQQVLADESPCIWLYANDNITLVNSKKIGNVTVFPIDYYLVTNEWTLEN